MIVGSSSAFLQAAGAIVLVGGAFMAFNYGGGYAWYRLVAYPRARRAARRAGKVLVGSNASGDEVFVGYSEPDWRHMTYAEWRKADEGVALQPRRVFAESELL